MEMEDVRKKEVGGCMIMTVCIGFSVIKPAWITGDVGAKE